MEGIGANHPLHKLKAKKNRGISEAGKEMREKGTEGSFTREAKGAGESVQERASKNYDAPGKEGKKARFAWLAGHDWKGKK